MLRLGVRLALRGGREAMVRLAVIAASVAVGVGVLLAVLADFHAFQATNGRPCWQCTDGVPVAASGSPSADSAEPASPFPARPAPGPDSVSELWNYRQDYYQGRTVERLDVAALGPDAPRIPGLARLPRPGEYFASPAMAALLATAPHDQLGARFPGTSAGTVGAAALSGPDDLVIVVGVAPEQLAALPGTLRVDRIETRSHLDSATDFYRFGFGMAAIALVFPLLSLIGTATRLAAARREERFAAFRLAGGTPRQVDVIASVDAVVGAALGTVAGIGVFELLRPAVARTAVTGGTYFSALVRPTAWEYALVLVGVPAAAAWAALRSLKGVRSAPLEASRRVTPRPPKAWRLLPLAVGVALIAVAPLLPGTPGQAAFTSHTGAQSAEGAGDLATPASLLGLLLIMLGLVVSGSWLTMRAARLVAGTARGASGLLSARRLADNPKAAFRSVSGLVLAVFVGTVVAGVVPAVNKGMRAVGEGTLTGVLRTAFVSAGGPDRPAGLAPVATVGLLNELRTYPGADVLPIYAATDSVDTVCVSDHECVPTAGVIECPALASFPALGRCAPGVTAVAAHFGYLLGHDNPASVRMPFVGADTPASGVDVATRPMEAVLIRTADPATLERIRTLLAGYTARTGSATPPKTFGEGASKRAAAYDQVQQATFAVVAVTLLVAGCSLAVAVGGGLVERKRAFTLLRLSGTPMPTLYRVVLCEAAVPLAGAAAVAAGAGLGTALSMTHALATDGSSYFELPGHVYFLTLGGGLLAAFAVIVPALPLLRRVTSPNDVRFE